MYFFKKYKKFKQKDIDKCFALWYYYFCWRVKEKSAS